MTQPVDLSEQECRTLLGAGILGRLALCTPDGPHIVPVNYAVAEGAVYVLTTPYSLLGTAVVGGRAPVLAFEVDHADHDRHHGWSVVARGPAEVVEDPGEVARLRADLVPRPWAEGQRTLLVRLRWRELTGRRVGEVDLADLPVQRRTL